MKYYLVGYKKAILIFLSFFIITTLVSILLFFALDDNDFFKDLPYTFELSDIIYSLIILSGIFYLNKKNKSLGRIKLSSPKNYSLLLYILIATILFKIAVDPILRLNEIIDTSSLPTENKPVFISLQKNILVFIDVIILTPIIEEIVFRGYILRAMQKNNSMTSKILFTSFLFTLLHIPSDLNSLFVIFIFGILLGYISLRFGLIYSIIFHTQYNLIWFVLHVFSYKYWSILNYLKFNYIYWGIFLLSAIIFLIIAKKTITDNKT